MRRVSAYGCFTTLVVDTDGVRGWNEHLHRLVRDSSVLFDRPITTAEVSTALHQAMTGVQRPAVVRIAVSARDHALNQPGGTDLVVDVSVRAAYAAPGPLRVATTQHRRALAHLKHLATTPELLVRRRAQAAGYDDALFIADGCVTEGPTWSLIAAIGDELVTPRGALSSVTVALLSRRRSITPRPVTPDELTRLSGAVAVNAGWGVRPITAIDGVALAGALADDLRATYACLPYDPI